MMWVLLQGGEAITARGFSFPFAMAAQSQNKKSVRCRPRMRG